MKTTFLGNMKRWMLLVSLCALAFVAKAQESFEVRGHVIDETGEDVIGATVTIQNKPG